MKTNKTNPNNTIALIALLILLRLLSESSVSLAQDPRWEGKDPCGCDAIIISNHRIRYEQAKKRRDFLSQIEASSFEELRKGHDGKAKFPIEGIPFEAFGSFEDVKSYRDFLSKRVEEFEESITTVYEATSFLDEGVVRAWENCMRDCLNDEKLFGLRVWPVSVREEAVIVAFVWIPHSPYVNQATTIQTITLSPGATNITPESRQLTTGTKLIPNSIYENSFSRVKGSDFEISIAIEHEGSKTLRLPLFRRDPKPEPQFFSIIASNDIPVTANANNQPLTLLTLPCKVEPRARTVLIAFDSSVYMASVGSDPHLAVTVLVQDNKGNTVSSNQWFYGDQAKNKFTRTLSLREFLTPNLRGEQIFHARAYVRPGTLASFNPITTSLRVITLPE